MASHLGSHALTSLPYASLTLQNPALMATKTSILVFYLRLSKNTEKVLRICSYVVLAIVNIAGAVLTLLNIFQCRPIDSAFTTNSGKCIPLLTEFICSAPVNILTDLAILTLPLPVLTGMRLPSRQKYILVFTFALGVFVTIVDVVRIYYLQQAVSSSGTDTSSNLSSVFIDSHEFSWSASFSLMWSAVEVNIGITCACIPTLKPLIIKILPAILTNPDGSLKYFSGTRDLEISDTPSHNLSRQQEAWSQTQPALPSQPATTPASEGSGGSKRTTSLSRMVWPRPSRKPDLSMGSGVGSDTTTLGSNRMTTANQLQNPALPGPSHQHGIEALNRPPSHQVTELTPPTVTDTAGSSQNAPLGIAGDVTTGTSNITTTSRENALYFGFVNLKKPKSMLDTTVSESLQYCTTVAILFFLWGFSYGLLNTLNNTVASVSNMTTTQTLGLTSAYFGGGYLFGPLLVGEWVLRHDEHHRRRIAIAQQKRRGGGTFSSLSASALAHMHASPQDELIGGFKATFIVGLCIYGIGTIIFWPSAVLTSFPGFLISNFVVGFGLSVLETAANPFLALCGPMEYSEMRLLLAQGLQGASSVVSSVLAQKVFFVSVGSDKSKSLLDAQWTYLAITLFCVALAMFFYYMPLPEVYDAELERAASRLPVDSTKRTIFGGLQLRTVCLVLAVMAQWLYVASQECMSLNYDALITSWLPAETTGNSTDSSSAATFSGSFVSRFVTSSTTSADDNGQDGLALSVQNYLLISRTAFAVSRFAVGFLSYLGVKHPGRWWLPSPRTMLTISIALSALFALLAVVLRPAANANLVVIPVTLFFFAEGPIYPLIFAIGLRGQGKRTKRAAAWLTVGASGPLFWPFVMYGIMDRGGSVQTSFIVVVCLLALALIYPLYLTFFRDAGQLTKLAPTDPLALKSRRLNQESKQIDEGGPWLQQDTTQSGAAASVSVAESGPPGDRTLLGDHAVLMPQSPNPLGMAHRPV